MKRLILATALATPMVAHAQPAQFCVSPSLAQTLAAALQQDAALLAMLNDSAQDSQRQAAAIAAAVAKQKADDESAARTGAADAPAAHVPIGASPVPAATSAKP